MSRKATRAPQASEISRGREPEQRHREGGHYPRSRDLRQRGLGHWVTTAGEGVEVLGSQSPAGRRMAESLEYFAFLREELPALLARWREYRTRRGQPGTGAGQGHVR